MDKKTVIVTGASSGIGKSIAKLFIDKNFNVVMNALNKENLQKTFLEFGSPDNAYCVAGSISHKGTGEKMVEAALDNFGSVDILINNAGVFAPKPFLEVKEEDIDYFYNTNLKGTFLTTQTVIKPMLKTGGAIINIGTVLVDHAIAGFPVSAPVISKGGIHALTRQLAAEFGKSNIRINTIAPGIIRSPLQGKIGVDDADSLAGLHLLNKIGETSDIADVVYLLATNSFITGETVNVDGGHVAGHNFS